MENLNSDTLHMTGGRVESEYISVQDFMVRLPTDDNLEINEVRFMRFYRRGEASRPPELHRSSEFPQIELRVR
jgi:hypothetical protein